MGKKKVTTLFTWWDIYQDVVYDIATRAGRTAVQTAVAAGVLTYAVGGDYEGAKTALLAGLAAGISLVWNASSAYINR